MNIAIIGSGYVGLVAAACMAEIGHRVVCVDNDERKIAALQAGYGVIHEEFLPELLARHAEKNLWFTTDLRAAAVHASLIFIAVGTPPTDTGGADLAVLESVCSELANSIDCYKAIVIKSTVPIGTNEWLRRILLRYGAAPEAFCVASNPEFLREGTAVTDFLYPDRIVIGAGSDRCSGLLRQLYQPLSDGSYARSKNAIPIPDAAHLPAKVIVTGPRSAEIIKQSSNAFLAMKISFINAVARICDSAGADVQEVCTGMGADSRIGPRFLKPGIGYGGSCFPKDLSAFDSVARELGCDFPLLEDVMRINEEQLLHFLRKVRSVLPVLKGKRLAVLGLAFKGGTDDIRESPAIAMIRLLLKEKCEIVAYDPAAMEKSKCVFAPGTMQFADNAYEAARDADALLVLTDWEDFCTLDFERLRLELRQPIVIDGRNLYSLAEMERLGFLYISVGRPAVLPSKVASEVATISPKPSGAQENAEAA